MAISPLLFFGIGATFLATILHIVGVATTHWFEIDSHILLRMDHMGLFKLCFKRHDVCADITADSSLGAVRAFAIIGVLLAFAVIGLAALFIVIKNFQNNKIFPILMLLGGLGACGSILLAIIIYAADYANTDIGGFGYSFALCIVGALGIGAGGALSFIGARSSAS